MFQLLPCDNSLFVNKKPIKYNLLKKLTPLITNHLVTIMHQLFHPLNLIGVCLQTCWSIFLGSTIVWSSINICPTVIICCRNEKGGSKVSLITNTPQYAILDTQKCFYSDVCFVAYGVLFDDYWLDWQGWWWCTEYKNVLTLGSDPMPLICLCVLAVPRWFFWYTCWEWKLGLNIMCCGNHCPWYCRNDQGVWGTGQVANRRRVVTRCDVIMYSLNQRKVVTSVTSLMSGQ